MAAAALRSQASAHARGHAGARLLGLALSGLLVLGGGLASALPSATLAQGTGDKPGTLTVGSGDTATALALKLRPEGATLEQTLVALWRANPRAFANGNLNLLLQGAPLQLPSEADILRLPAAQARALVLEQVENFQAFARQQGASAAAAPNSGVKPGTTAPNPAPDPAAWARALAEAQALKDALERQNRDTQARLAQLEKNIQTLQGLQASSASTGPAALPALPVASSDAPPLAAASASDTPASAGPDAASTPPAASAGRATDTVNEPGGLGRPTLLWGAAALVLGLMLLWTWLHQRGRDRAQAQALARPRGTDHKPAPQPAHSAATSAGVRTDIPPLLASIDLNLGEPSAPPHEERRP